MNIPADEQCDIRCVGDEYCRNTRLGIRCCRTTLINFSAQGGIVVRRCSESCVLPPRQPPQPVRTEEPSETPHTDRPSPSVTEKPTPSEKPDESTTQAPTDAPSESRIVYYRRQNVDLTLTIKSLSIFFSFVCLQLFLYSSIHLLICSLTLFLCSFINCSLIRIPLSST